MQPYITVEKYKTILNVQRHDGRTERESANKRVFGGVHSLLYNFMTDKNPETIQIGNSKPQIERVNRLPRLYNGYSENTVHLSSAQTERSLTEKLHFLMTNQQPPWKKSTPSFTELWQEFWEAAHEGDQDETQVINFADSIGLSDKTRMRSPKTSLQGNRYANSFRRAMSPPPIENPSQPVLAFERLVTDVERAATQDIDLQTVLTSMPPKAATKKSLFLQITAIAIIFSVFTGVLVLIANTPSPSQDQIHSAAAGSTKPIVTSPPMIVPIKQMHQKLAPKQGAPTGEVERAKGDDSGIEGSQIEDSRINAIVKVTNRFQRTGRVNKYSSISTATAKKTKPSAIVHPQTIHPQNLQPQNLQPQNLQPQNLQPLKTRSGEPTVEGLLASSSLPALPPRISVKSALDRITPQMRRCGLNGSGRVVVRVTFSGTTGGVVSAQFVDNPFQGTAASQCALNAVRRAQLPMFKKNVLTIKYPFNL